MAVRECFLYDEGVAGVVHQRVAEGGGFGCALGGVIVAGRLDDFAEFAVGGREAGVGFLDVELGELDAEVGFSQAECYYPVSECGVSPEIGRANIFGI